MNVTTATHSAASTLAEFVGLEKNLRMDETGDIMDGDLGVSPVTLSPAWSRVARLLLLASLAVGGSVGNVFMISAIVVEDQLKKRGKYIFFLIIRLFILDLYHWKIYSQ